MSPVEGDRFFDAAAGVRLRYLEQGDGEPVVLLHSYTGNVERQWVSSGVLDALSGHYRVFALDQRGHGRSSKPHDPSAYGREMALDVVRLLDHLGIDRAHVVGYSMGAHVTAQLVMLAPQRLCSAVFGGAPGRLSWTADDEAQSEREADEMEQGLLTSQVLRLWPPDRPLPAAAELARRSMLPREGQDLLALAAFRRAGKAQVVSARDIADAGVPILGIVGSADPYRSRMHALRDVVTTMKIVTLEGARHADAPLHAGFVPAIVEFLRQHPSHDAPERAR
jgi:pimeloyl-ACP methyl ester carboxylesterase